jgi:AraC-like DNA-binding protein
MDPLSPLLDRLSLKARVFFAGALCDASSFARQPGLGAIHVFRHGHLRVNQENGAQFEVTEPSVLFYPRPHAHKFGVDRRFGAELVCGWIDFGAGLGSPLLRGLPDLILAPLARIPGLEATLNTLFEEAFGSRPGRQAALNRLIEYVLVLLLRYAMQTHLVDGSVLAALADARLSKAIVAMHEKPDQDWSLTTLAREAGMSRARFAAHFRAVTDVTPLDYLTDLRIGVSQSLLKRGTSLKLIAPRVGYQSSVALARVFSRRVGCSPNQWLAEHYDKAGRLLQDEALSPRRRGGARARLKPSGPKARAP